MYIKYLAFNKCSINSDCFVAIIKIKTIIKWEHYNSERHYWAAVPISGIG